MTDIDKDNPHTEYLSFCRVVYWRDGVACGKLDDWTSAEVDCFNGHQVAFDVTERRRLGTCLMLLERAFELGRRHKAEEVRKALGIA